MVWCHQVFDSVPHLPLMEKIRLINLQELIIQWLNNYLTERSQVVVIKWFSVIRTPGALGCPTGLCVRASVVSHLFQRFFPVLFRASVQKSIYLQMTSFFIKLFQILTTMPPYSWQ